MPNSTDNEIVASLVADIRTSSKSDKAFWRKEGREFREKIDSATAQILKLSTEKARLERDVRFFRDTKLSREIGAGVLTVCGLTAPLFIHGFTLPVFSLWWWFGIGYYCVVFGAAVSVFWGVWFSRIKMDKPEIV